MKRIGLLSDTHGWWDNKYIEYFSGCDEIWHAGDIGSQNVLDGLELIAPVRAVYGNIDDHTIRLRCPKILRFTVEGAEIWITHIGGYPGRYAPEMRQELALKHPNLLVCGHSHLLKIEFDKRRNMLYMNPGAAGKYGPHRVRTLVRFSIEAGNFKDLEVIELAGL